MVRLLKSVLIIFSFLFLCVTVVFAEDITITTYYPSPYGSYNALQTNRLGVGDNNADGVLNSSDVPGTNGDVWVSGHITMGYQVVTVTIPSTYDIGWYTCDCPAGKRALGGACSGSGVSYTYIDAGGAGYHCYKNNQFAGNWQIQAVCANML
ncbi:MAG: hypothetical protein PHC71_05790 [Candidatus Omnitrophica bacterium]|nr:hypothetical protein [Candidatus Omnitrophota bacterium]